MLKFLSCAMVLFSSTFLGFLKAADFEKREKILRCFISDLEFIKNEITHLKTPIFEVLRKLGNSNGETGAFYRAVAEKFVQSKDVPLSEIFDAETEKINEYFPLKKGDGDGLHMLARSLGKSDTDGQSALILQAERALNILLDEAVSEKNKNARLYKSLGFYFGILLVIMFF